MEQQSLVINCIVLSYPPPTIRWLNSSGTVLVEVSNSSQLLLNFTGTPANGGVYTCVGISGDATANASVNITVLSKWVTDMYMYMCMYMSCFV